MHLLKASLVFIALVIIIGCAGPPPPPPPPAEQPQHAQAKAPVSNQPAAEFAPGQTGNVAPALNLETGAEPVAETAPESGGEPAAAEALANAPGDCPAAHFLSVQAHPANGAYPAPQLSATCTGSTLVVQSNGIPNFEFVQITPNRLQAQNYNWEIPLNPRPAAQPGDIPALGAVAVAVNGIPIFGPNEAPQDDWGDPYLDGLLDYCNGHTAQQGIYHFHARPDCIFANIEGQVGLVIGYAFDGYPILAPYICQTEDCSQTQKVTSSWQRTQDVRNAWEAHQYVAGSGNLDRCNGMEMADGSYAYFATDTFPYFLACYHGVANVSNQLPGSGPPQGENANQGGAPQNQNQGFAPNLAAAAVRLGVSEQALREALGPPPPDMAAAAARLGVSEQALQQALQP